MTKKPFLILFSALAGFFFLVGQTGSTGNPKSGKIVFEKYCSSCHGKSGRGLGPSTRMPNFSDNRYQESHTPQELFDKISHGVEGSGMPSWEKTLSQEERWNIVSYIKTLGR